MLHYYHMHKFISVTHFDQTVLEGVFANFDFIKMLEQIFVKKT